MTNKELISRIAERTDLSRAESEQLLRAFATIVSDETAKGNTVHLRQFGDFEVREKKERVMVHPKTGEKILIPQKRQLYFKQSPSLKAELK